MSSHPRNVSGVCSHRVAAAGGGVTMPGLASERYVAIRPITGRKGHLRDEQEFFDSVRRRSGREAAVEDLSNEFDAKF